MCCTSLNFYHQGELGNMNLTEGTVGRSYRVEKINTPQDTERRLETLGITEGSSLSVLNKKRCGTMIVKSRGTRFAVGSKIAADILIRRAD